MRNFLVGLIVVVVFALLLGVTVGASYKLGALDNESCTCSEVIHAGPVATQGVADGVCEACSPTPTATPVCGENPWNTATRTSEYTNTPAEDTPTPTVTPTPSATNTPKPEDTATLAPTTTSEPTERPDNIPCNRGLGNRAENCDPGNSGGRPGKAGEDNEPAGPKGKGPK